MSYLSVDKLQLEICSPDAIDWQAQPLRHDTACSSMSKVAVDPDLLLLQPRGVKRAEALNMQKEQSYARKIYPLVSPTVRRTRVVLRMASSLAHGDAAARPPQYQTPQLPPASNPRPRYPQVTLLLMNSATNEALRFRPSGAAPCGVPAPSPKTQPEYHHLRPNLQRQRSPFTPPKKKVIAILISVTVVLIVGEILPTALFTDHISARTHDPANPR